MFLIITIPSFKGIQILEAAKFYNYNLKLSKHQYFQFHKCICKTWIIPREVIQFKAIHFAKWSKQC